MSHMSVDFEPDVEGQDQRRTIIGFRNGFLLSMLFWVPVLYLIFG